jgi:hypothetical protein
VGSADYVRFEVATASGGTDAIIAVLNTVAALGPSALERSSGRELNVLGPNPTRGGFSISTSFVPNATARLDIFDLAGRRIAGTSEASGSVIRWDGRKSDGSRAPAGVYTYRITIGSLHKAGKLIVVR